MTRIAFLFASAGLVSCAAPDGAIPVVETSDCRVDVRPIELPLPAYPAAEAVAGYEDTCNLRFDIDYSGSPFNIDTRCTFSVFRDSAEEAVSRVRFDPALATALPPGRQCAGYVVAYRLE